MKKNDVRVVLDGENCQIFAFEEFTLRKGQVLTVVKSIDEEGDIYLTLLIDEFDVTDVKR